jgi:hypothetical protein
VKGSLVLEKGEQAPGLHCQVTPELLKSFATVATTEAEPPNCIEVAPGTTLILMGGGITIDNLTVAAALG